MRADTMGGMEPGRIHFADALRGFALVGILLVHSLEHFELFLYPESGPVLGFFDRLLRQFIMFVFGGKAYAIFSLLFGFSFFIQDNNRLRQGKDFRGRFLWRLVLLAGWGFINRIFYAGDILLIFAVVGVALGAVARLKDRTVLWIALILVLQPVELAGIVTGIFNPSEVEPAWKFYPYYLQTQPVMEKGSFMEVVAMNMSAGRNYCHIWYAESGRLLQIAALFMTGMLIGRRKLFAETAVNTSFWVTAAVVALPTGIALGGLNDLFAGTLDNAAVMQPLGIILESLSSLAIMVFIVGTLYLAYYKTRLRRGLDFLSPYGRMSLTMYITQGALGTFAFYGWGLSLAEKLSITQTIPVALAIFALQYTFAVLWFRKFRHGPFEWVWKKATWICPRKE